MLQRCMINEKGLEMHESDTSSTLEMMRQFVGDAGQIYSQETQDRLHELRAENLRCVDDRDDGSAEIIAIAGAGLGVLIDIFGGLKLLDAHVDLQRVADIFANEFGLPSYHTDMTKLGSPLCCAGCGHCSGALANPEQYLLSDEAIAFLAGYLPELSEQVEPTVYSGGHSAQATIIVAGTDAGLRASFNGTNVFVYQPDWHQLYLGKAAESLSQELNINATVLADAFAKAANNDLTVTLEKLAKGLPVYTLHSSDGQLLLTEG